MDDPDISDGVSENEYSEPEQEIEKEDDDNTDMAEQKSRTDNNGNGKGLDSAAPAKPKLDPKDPLRPRRKKARRACFACQRAHLTCGMLSSSLAYYCHCSYLYTCLVNSSLCLFGILQYLIYPYRR